MIETIKHKGLKLFFIKGDRRKIPADRVEKIRNILTVIHTASVIEEIDQPAYRLHPLKGQLIGFYAIDVTANYRLIFRFENGNAYDLDLVDYH